MSNDGPAFSLSENLVVLRPSVAVNGGGEVVVARQRIHCLLKFEVMREATARRRGAGEAIVSVSVQFDRRKGDTL